MRVGEANAFAGQSIQIRRGDFRLGVEAAHVAVAEVVGQDKDNVRTGGAFAGQQRYGYRQKSRNKPAKSNQSLKCFRHGDCCEQEVTEETERQANRIKHRQQRGVHDHGLRERNANGWRRQVLSTAPSVISYRRLLNVSRARPPVTAQSRQSCYVTGLLSCSHLESYSVGYYRRPVPPTQPRSTPRFPPGK